MLIASGDFSKKLLAKVGSRTSGYKGVRSLVGVAGVRRLSFCDWRYRIGFGVDDAEDEAFVDGAFARSMSRKAENGREVVYGSTKYFSETIESARLRRGGGDQ